MSELTFGHQMSELWTQGLLLGDLLETFPPAVLGAAIVLEEAATVTRREELSDEAKAALSDLERFVEDCRGCFGVEYPPELLLRIDGLQQRLAVAEITVEEFQDASFWRNLLRAYLHTGHGDLLQIVEGAERFLAEQG